MGKGSPETLPPQDGQPDGPGTPPTVEYVVRTVLAAVAPEELADFEANAAAFFTDPAATLMPERPNQPAGFGDVVIGLMGTALLGGVSGLISDSLKAAVEKVFVKAARSRRWRKGSGPEAERVREQARRYAGDAQPSAEVSQEPTRHGAPDAVLSAPLSPVEPAQIEPLVDLVGALAALSNIPEQRTAALCTALRSALQPLAAPAASSKTAP